MFSRGAESAHMLAIVGLEILCDGLELANEDTWGERVGIEPTTDLFRARHRI